MGRVAGRPQSGLPLAVKGDGFAVDLEHRASHGAPRVPALNERATQVTRVPGVSKISQVGLDGVGQLLWRVSYPAAAADVLELGPRREPAGHDGYPVTQCFGDDVAEVLGQRRENEDPAPLVESPL